MTCGQMSYEQIAAMMEEMELPFAYHHFAEGERTFSADNEMYFSSKQLDIELYTDRKQPETERQVESVLRRHHIFYQKSEQWIDSEQFYEVLYEMEV